MPGILPMKVIKVGNSSQSRIAQACDRCRSKKIRCDGVRPCCTQCANVGFECKTSDKLSRRAFPRGYTESLEERVRSLEAEVRDLKSLLDEKDEKIDVLSRIHSFAKRRPSLSSAAGSMSESGSEPKSQQQQLPPQPAPEKIEQEEVIPVRQTCPPAGPPAETPFPAMSSTHRFADFFAEKFLTLNDPSARITFTTLTARPAPVAWSPTDREMKTPPRLVSDQLINIFFQEWAPLYPVVHRPTILKAYEQYLSDEESLRGNRTVMAQLNLIFGIAALSSTARTDQDPTCFEATWASSLNALSSEVSLPALQCFVLAEIYCMTKADYKNLLRYRAIATNLCHRLGLHHSQTSFAHNPLVTETRKKTFWCQYVLDRFTSALIGLPALLRTEDIHTEYPVDVDDENVTETGFLPTLPGESTRLSSALALFEVSRILNTALDVLYPSGADYDISVSEMRSVAEELDAWSKNLPQHLRLQFSQDKPSTHVTSSRSPLLSLVYYWIRSLIHRPAACFASQNLSSPSSLVLSDCSKHIMQILQLLDERRLCLSVSINRKELIVMSGIGLLRQFVGLNRESKLARESQRLLTTVVDQLERESSSAAAEFSAIANRLTCGDVANTNEPITVSQEMPAPARKSRSPQHQLLQSLKHRLSMSGKSSTTTTTMTTSPPPPTTANTDALSRRNTISGTRPAAAAAAAAPSPSLSPSQHPLRSSSSRASLHSQPSENVSYSSPHHNGLPIHHHGLPPPNNYDASRAMSCSALTEPPAGAASGVTMSEWEYVLGNMDRGYSNIFNGIYGGRMCGDHFDHDDDGDGDGDTAGPFAALTAEYARKMQQEGHEQQQQQQQQQQHRHSVTGVEGSFPYTTAAAASSTATTAAAVAPSSELPDLSPVAWSSSSGGVSGGNGDISTGTHRLLSFSEESSLGSSVEESFGHYALLDPYGDDSGGAVRLVALEDEFEGFGGLLEGWDRQLAV